MNLFHIKSALFAVVASVLSMSSFASVRDADEPATNTPEVVSVWSWITDIYDIDYRNQQMAVKMYLTFSFTNTAPDTISPMDNLEILNAKTFSLKNKRKTVEDGLHKHVCACTTTLKVDWDTSSYPFDSQQVDILMEDYDNASDKQIYVNDPDSGIESGLHTPQWRIVRHEILTNSHEWGWGDVYSRYIIRLELKRTYPWGLFCKTFLCLIIAMMIAFLSLFVRPTDVDPRFGLPLAAIFAAVGSHYVIASYLPDTPSFSFVDKMHNLSYFYLLLCFIISTISLQLCHHDKVPSSCKLDRYASIVLPCSYVVTIAVLLALL